MRRGLEVGLIMGGVFSILPTVIATFNSGYFPIRGREVSIIAIWISYLVLAPVTGALFGAMLPFMRNVFAAYLLGLACSAPLIGFIGIVIDDFRMTGTFWFATLLTALILGGFGGIAVRQIATK